MIWGSSAGLESRDWQPRSAQIEMASYVLLARFRRGSLVEGFALMKWLSKQRNHLGGYGTTQVTLHLFFCYLKKLLFIYAAGNTRRLFISGQVAARELAADYLSRSDRLMGRRLIGAR